MVFEVELALISADADAEELDAAARRLRADLLEGDVQDVLPAPGRVSPDSSKGFDISRIGEMVVTLAQLPDALTRLVSSIRQWVSHTDAERGYSVRLVLGGDELVVDRVSEETQLRLIEAFLQAHSDTAAPDHGSGHG